MRVSSYTRTVAKGRLKVLAPAATERSRVAQRLMPNLGGSSNGQKGETALSDVLFPLSAPSAPQPRPSRLIPAATRSSKVQQSMCCDREGGVLDRERGNKVVDHWRS